MRPDTLSKLAVTAAICATVASGIAVGMANGRINDLEMQRDIYKSRAEDWEGTAGIVAQYADDLADELKIRSKLDEKIRCRVCRDFQMHCLLHREMVAHLRHWNRDHGQRSADSGGRDRGGRPKRSCPMAQ